MLSIGRASFDIFRTVNGYRPGARLGGRILGVGADLGHLASIGAA